ncbi:UPF0179 family protein [Methanomassiliicoccales archaeon LGM-RCC1]|nr:UPF0179 family protein [Methanomassiliicoccales archaeon LGM-RCC1]
MAQITLIGKDHATVDSEFYYLGPMEECAECKFNKVCFNLEEGARYKVVSIRLQEHECHEFDGDSVTAVEVEKVCTPATVSKRQAMEGSKITYKGSECKNLSCENYALCHPIGKVPGTKYVVQKVNGDLDCPLGEKLVLVNLF